MRNCGDAGKGGAVVFLAAFRQFGERVAARQPGAPEQLRLEEPHGLLLHASAVVVFATHERGHPCAVQLGRRAPAGSGG